MGRRPPGAAGGRPSPAGTPGRAARRTSPRERVPACSPVRDAVFCLARPVTSDRLPPRAAAAGSKSGETRFPRGRVRAPEFFDDVPSVGAGRRGTLCIPFIEQRRAEFATGPRLDGRPESHRNPTWGAFDKVRRGGATASVDEARSRFERASADARVAAQRRVAENCHRGPSPPARALQRNLGRGLHGAREREPASRTPALGATNADACTQPRSVGAPPSGSKRLPGPPRVE